ncbi:hypothetical protein [Streptomyces lydicamycinicus]
MGAGPGFLPLGTLHAGRLAELIRTAVDQPRYAQRSRLLAAELAQEDGGGRTVEAVDRLLNSGRGEAVAST